MMEKQELQGSDSGPARLQREAWKEEETVSKLLHLPGLSANTSHLLSHHLSKFKEYIHPFIFIT